MKHLKALNSKAKQLEDAASDGADALLEGWAEMWEPLPPPPPAFPETRKRGPGLKDPVADRPDNLDFAHQNSVTILSEL